MYKGRVDMKYARAICYSGYRKGQNPPEAIYPSYDEIVEDMKILDQHGFKYIRMYDPIPYAEMTCKVIRDLGLDIKLMLGPGLQCEVNNPGCPWMKMNFSDEELAEHARHNDKNIDELIRIANENADIINAVSVGNENTPDWGANNVPVERLISFARRLKAGTGKPVTFNEGAWEWPRIPELAKELDIISVHSYPLWHGVSIEDAVAENKEAYVTIKGLYPDKEVLFSEVGWSTKSQSDGQMNAKQANEETQKDYYEEFWKWADEAQVIAYMFEAFDEPWKGGDDPNEAEKHWGIYNEDRTPKKVMQA